MAEQAPLVQALLAPRAYPHRPDRVDLAQTQMSFVFLTGDYVYKMKKPVDLGYLDYTTLERRQHFCHQEVMLNKRLCPDVYLDVVPITEESGEYAVEGKGEIIEYAVKMRQLPVDRTMDNLIRQNQVSKEMVGQVARKLALFHQAAETNKEICSYGDLSVLTTNTEENFNQTEKYIGISLLRHEYDTIKSYTRGFIEEKAPLFHRRMKDGRIRDCHGDLHAAHVCFANGIQIFDCIEFNDRFRYCDVASEIAFLAMDLDYLGRPDLSRSFVEEYMEASGDQDMQQVLDFYKCYRAYVRGKVESFKLDDAHLSSEEKDRALDSAKRYFKLAQSYIPEDLYIVRGS